MSIKYEVIFKITFTNIYKLCMSSTSSQCAICVNVVNREIHNSIPNHKNKNKNKNRILSLVTHLLGELDLLKI